MLPTLPYRIRSAHFEENLDDEVPKQQKTLERYFGPCNRAGYAFSKISRRQQNAPTPVFITIGTVVFFERAKAAAISSGVRTSI